LEASNLSTGRSGDVITAANGQPVRSGFDLMQQLEQLGVGRRIELTVDRNGRRMLVDLEIVDIGVKP
jgi:2-alkenal reductase